VQGEADYLRRSMLAGAREFLIKPFSSDELVSSIKRVFEVAPPRPVQTYAPQPGPAAPGSAVPPNPADAGRIVSVFGPKGGVGCSTFSTNLAIALRETTQEPTALVDGNLQFGGIDVLLNLQATRTIADLASKGDDIDSELISSVMMPHPSGIKVLLAPSRPEMADMVQPDLMKELLQHMKSMFRYIVVDTWTSLQDLTLSILDAADRVLLLATPEVMAIKNAKVFFDVAEALDYTADKTWMVINQADRRGAIRISDIESSIKHPIAAAIPLDDRGVFMSANQGVPLVVSHRGSPVAQAVFGLAERLAEEYKIHRPEVSAAAEKVPTAHQGGLLGRLFG
jgi:pilus assembly protein CpaE